MLEMVLDREKKQMTQTNKQYGHPDFYKLLDQMAELHSRKNHDYAGTSDPLKNLRACTRLELDPFIGVMVRLQDKWSRIEEFVKSKTLLVKNESVEDTLMDNAVYSLLAIILLREQKKSESGDYNALEIDGPHVFQPGDTVRIKLSSGLDTSMTGPVEKANGIGKYLRKGSMYHTVLTADIELLLNDDEVFPVEDRTSDPNPSRTINLTGD